jgi:hypothetical protein
MPEGITAVAVFGSIALITVGCTLAVQWRKASIYRFEVELKKEMLQRGMSVEDIKAVLQVNHQK